MARARVMIGLDLDVSGVDDDEWIEALTIDLKRDLEGLDWFIDEVYGLDDEPAPMTWWDWLKVWWRHRP